MQVTVIAKVRSTRKTHQWHGWQGSPAEIHILPDYVEGLDGLEDYSHLIVLHVMDNGGTTNLRVTPQGKPSSPCVGVFASRCMWRPTAAGVTTVRLLGVDGSVLKVEGLDAVDGTDVIDIKPYWPQYDAVEEPRYPRWVDKLEF